MDAVKKITGKLHYNSPVILTYAMVSFVVLLIGYATGMKSTYALFSAYSSSPVSALFYIRLFGHTLGHASFEHYINNFLIIFLIGPMLEERYGWKNMLCMMGITAVVTGVTQVIFFNTALLGASGIVFMLILLSSFANLKKGKIPVTLLLCLVVFVGREVYDSFIINDNISRITHIIGGICGSVFGLYINRGKMGVVPQE